MHRKDDRPSEASDPSRPRSDEQATPVRTKSQRTNKLSDPHRSRINYPATGSGKLGVDKSDHEAKGARRSRKSAAGSSQSGHATPGARQSGHAATGSRQSRRAAAGARELALDALCRVEEQGAYSGLVLNAMLTDANLSRNDAALATEIVYGTIQRRNTIDDVLSARVKGWPRKIAPWVRSLLRLSYYQLRWLDRIPAHAAVDEAVRIAKRRGHAGISGLVNGVLRGLLRDGLVPALPADLSPAERLALTHSHPVWLVERWIDCYGEQTAASICAANNEPPHASVRVNRLRTDCATMLSDMRQAGFSARESSLSQDGIIADKAGNLVDTAWHRDGLFSVQDESSMLVAAALDPQPGMTVLDMCAAPGGKTMYMAELMQNQGKVIANDIHEHKRGLIDMQKERLGLAIVETMTGDAAQLDQRFPASTMDAVLLDAPCSGFGVIRRKPEIKWNRQPQDIVSLTQLQQQLLHTASRLVRPGGVLVYSTCTIIEEENENAIRGFLREHPDYELDTQWPEQVLQPLREKGICQEPFAGFVQLLPHHFGSDGFFIARMRRRKSP